MEIIEVTVFSFDELGDEAKEKARSWYREGLEYPWFDESLASIRAFVEHFGGSLTDWSLGSGSGRDYLKTDIGASNFRGLKLKDFSPDNMPTGYCWIAICGAHSIKNGSRQQTRSMPSSRRSRPRYARFSETLIINFLTNA